MKPMRFNDQRALSRRTFHHQLAATAAGLAAMPLVGRGTAVGADGPKTSAGDRIDMHVHLGQPWAGREPLTPDILLGWMDEHRISQAVVLPLISPEAWYYPITTEWVLEKTRAHRDRLIPFCDVDPRTEYVRTPKAILDILKRYQDAGAKGFGEHKCGGPIDSPGNIEVFRAAGELGWAVLLHMDSIRNTDAPGLPGLERVLREAPQAKFIGHAPAFWASISGDVTEKDLAGYPKGPIVPGGALDRLMDEYPNLYGELSAGSGAGAFRRDPAFARQFMLRRADRLLFGTDYLAVGQEIPQFGLLDPLDLPEEVKAKIYRSNAQRLLRL